MRSLIVLLLCVAAIGLVAPVSRAQDDFPEPGMMPPPPPPGDFPPDSPVVKWMERVKQEHPEEFARLQALRDEDPRAFRRELHKRMKGEQALAGMRKYPRIAQALKEMPEDQREEFLSRFFSAPDGPPESRGPGFGHGPRQHGGPGGPDAEPGGMPPPDPETRRIQREARDMVQAYREEPDETVKNELRLQLRGLIAQLFELREAERARQIERIEQDLTRLKKSMESRRKNRDAIIDKRLNELTTDPDLAL